MKYSEFQPFGTSNATNKQFALIAIAIGSNAPEIWREMAELNFVALRCDAALKHMSDQAIADLSIVLVYQLIASMGGGVVYIPNGFKSVRGEKYALIAKEYTGNNLRQLASKYGVSEMRIRQIVQDDAKSKKATSKKVNQPSNSTFHHVNT